MTAADPLTQFVTEEVLAGYMGVTVKYLRRVSDLSYVPTQDDRRVYLAGDILDWLKGLPA